MSIASGGPGKTAPKLVHDFLVFDPLRTAQNANYLTDISPPVGDGPQLAPLAKACKHEYTTKQAQSVLPPLDFRPNGETEYKAAVICKRCRIHADIHIASPEAEDPCPNSEYPLHHFQRLGSEDKVTHDRIINFWQCSAPDCGARLRITYRIQRLSDADKHLITNTEYLRRRFEAVVTDDPSREGIRQATPVEALGRLRKYIRDSLNPAHAKRTFPANNKRFMEAFGLNGQDCQELLTRLGFKYGDREWQLPNPEPVNDRLRAEGSSQREMLEDVELELSSWQAKMAAETGQANPGLDEWPSASRDIDRTFATQGYPRHATTRRAPPANELLPYFFSLGALPDFADSLIIFAFDRQFACDPERRAYYFECLQAIAESRGTEQLQMTVATLSSRDLISRRDLFAAYRYLHVDTYSDAHNVPDERIIDKFQALQSDSGAQAQEDARQALYKIGIARGSQRLINASRQTLETYEDALLWLGNGVDKDTPDEALLAVVALKTADIAANEEIAIKAITVINRTRKSNQLNNWLLTGRTDGYTMSADEAARHLGIEQNVESLDPSILPAIFEGARADRPGETTEKAITAIQQALMGASTAAMHPPETWPVGLTSHGNTCYLNSLLQYYFSIRPLRDIVLNYDKYRFDTARNQKKTQRVGRLLSMTEIKGGQRFAADLKHLFERMIEDPGEHVKPEEDLVCRAFLKPQDYALLGEDKPLEAQSATLMDSAIDENPDASIAGSKTSTDEEKESNASSTTLQSSIAGDGQDTVMKNGEMPPTPPASPRLGAEGSKPDVPKTAPPLPPRRFSTAKKEEALRLAESKARQQQDVAEVHDEIMFRLRSGMKPKNSNETRQPGEDLKDSDETGEQQDDLRELFLIGMRETAVKDGVDGEKTSLFETDIQTSVPEMDTDVYSALDQVFDLEAVGDKLTKYKSIHTLPPLLQINTPRINFDRKKLTNYKSDVCMKLDDELYLDRYCEDLNPEVILPRRRRCWAWRRQLRELQKEAAYLRKTPTTDLSLPEQISEVAKYFSSVRPGQDKSQQSGQEDTLTAESADFLRSAIGEDAVLQAEKLTAIEAKITELSSQIKSQFDDLRQIKYRLAAVFFHRGGTSSGHYWIYIHDFENDIWRRYNDERVEEFTQLDEIFEAKHYNHGTPTYAVYVRDDAKTEYISPVCRHLEEPKTEESADDRPLIDMEDVNMETGDAQEQRNANAALESTVPESDGAWDEVRDVPSQTKW